MSQLQLTRPVAFIDLETTGVNVASDRIVELSILRIQEDGSETSLTMRVNPEMPIPESSSAIHGIMDADVADEPTFADIAQEVHQFIKGCDLAGYNSNKFDVPLLAEEFLRVEVDFSMKNRRLIDVQNIFFKKEPRTLSAAYKFYCNKELEEAHSAEADIKATYEILKAQLERYEDLDGNIDHLSAYSTRQRNADLMGRIVYDNNDQPTFNFGKYRGQTVKDVFTKDPSYYAWMMNGDFPLYTKKMITSIRLEMKSE